MKDKKQGESVKNFGVPSFWLTGMHEHLKTATHTEVWLPSARKSYVPTNVVHSEQKFTPVF